MFCPTCKSDNADDAAVCVGCGKPLNNATSASIPSLPKGATLKSEMFKAGPVLGRSRFDITYKGGDMNLKRYVAIKEFCPTGCVRNNNLIQPAGNITQEIYDSAKQKFLQEARTLAQFNDPGIVNIFAIFEENNSAYMVMEFLEGQTLEKVIAERGALSYPDSMKYLAKVFKSLAIVHAAKLVHGNLCPENVIVTKDGRVVLIGFGAHNNAPSKYTPLEQYGSQARSGIASDVYALGAILYYCLTGVAPVSAKERSTGVSLLPPYQVNSSVPSAINHAVMKAMQINASERFQSVKDFASALQSANVPTAAAPSQIVPIPDPPAAPPPLPATMSSAVTTPSQFAPIPDPPATQKPGNAAWVRVTANGQLLTNAGKDQILVAIQQAFQSQNVRNITPDPILSQVRGSTGVSMLSYGQQILGQIYPQADGSASISVTSDKVFGLTDFGRGQTEQKNILNALERNLRLLTTTSGQGYETSPSNSSAYSSSPPPIQGNLSATPPSSYGSNYSPQTYVQGGKGTTILVLGLLGLVICGFLAPVAWIMGNQALSEYGDADPGDRGTVNAGRWMGIVGTILWILLVLIKLS